MNSPESKFDLYIHDLLKEAGIEAEYQGTSIKDLNDALRTASKSQTGEPGRPDYVAVVKDYVIVIENKADRDKLCLRDDSGNIALTVEATKYYAVNGALFYAKKILEHGAFRKIFAFGNAGDNKHHIFRPLYVDREKIIELKDVETFENFSPQNIENYYKRAVLKEVLPEEIELEDLEKKAKELHEHLRNYGSLGETEKPLVVSAILLALMEQDYGFRLEQLTGDEVEKAYDGAKLYEQLVRSLTRAKVSPEVKRERVLNQFTLIKDRPILNTKRHDLGDKTPLKYFAEYINEKIYRSIKGGKSHEDYLGRFYGEFVSYSGGDGQSLGVVLTPGHITELFCDLLELDTSDVIFDPCCGTGGFLIAGMHRMLNAAKSAEQQKHIKQKQIYGIELRDDMFSIATTNMILRGDGQSNLTCEDFFAKDPKELQLLGITKGFMNPPYSQAKNRQTANLSELNFIYHLLESILPGGKAAVIIPVSAMIGKTKEDRYIKADILKHHTLEGVISLNKNTFYGIGTVPCIAVFTAGEPHQPDKLVKFINFEDDGFEVKMHLGLKETERAKDRKQYLLDCWNGKQKDYPSKFMVETTIEAGDEWLHSFYYYNDEIPTEQDFVNSIADYLTFEFNMIVHGRGYLFESGENTPGSDEALQIEGRRWGKFAVGDTFSEIQRGKRLKTSDHIAGFVPYVSSSGINNGVDSFISNTKGIRKFNNCLTIANSGSVGSTFFHNYEFIASDHVTALKSEYFMKDSYIFATSILRRLQEKYSFNREINEARINHEKIVLPIDEEGKPDFAFMESYIRQHEQKLLREYIERKHQQDYTRGGGVTSFAQIKWKGFFISEVAEIISGRGIFDNERISGYTPYITSSAVNNGVTYFLSNTNETLEADCISVNSNGSVGYAFYHPYKALYSGDCRKLRLNFRSKYTAIFIARQITAQKEKYNYGYKMGTARLKRQKIMLPVDAQGQPDYIFMEKFIRHHEQKLLREYLEKISARLHTGGGVC